MYDDQQNYGDDSGGNGNGATAYADLAVNQIYVQPAPAQATEQVILGVEAINGGSAESGPFKARYTIDNGDSQDFNFPSIQPGSTHYEDWTHMPMQAGNYTFTALLDVDNQIQESNRDDNNASMSFVIQDATAPADGNGSQDMGQADDGQGQGDSGGQPLSSDDANQSSAELDYEGDMTAEAGAEAGGDGDVVLTAADGGGGVSVKDFVEVGKFVYDVMKDSAPTSSISGNSAAVIPSGASLNELTGWYGTPHEMRVTYVSKKRADPLFRTTIPLVVQWEFGGQYKGHGRYINKAVVFVDSGMDIGSFYNVNITCDLTGSMNMGNETDPLVRMPVRIEVQENDKTTPYQFRKVYEGYLQADGEGHLALRS